MKNKHLLLAGLLCCMGFSVFSQTDPDIVMGPNVIGPSPNASSLGEYADIPVSLYTGVPETSIPLYNIKSGSLSLPISLSYHSQGVKVEEVASDVGLGWTLNAGGAVTRAVRGLPDDYNGSEIVNNSDPCGDAGSSVTGGGLGYMYTLSTVDWGNPTASTNGIPRAAQGIWDGEPDMFYFNFSGYSGQFVFDKNKVPHLLSQSDLLIQNSFDGTTGEITNFTITAPDGTKFYFAAAERTTAFSLGAAPMGPFWLVGDPYYSYYESASSYVPHKTAYNSAWYLTKIESATVNSTITLSYTDTKQIYLGGISQDLRPEAYQNSNAEYTASYQVRHVAGKSLSQILFATGEIDFTYATQQRQDVGGMPTPVSSALSSLGLTTSPTYALADIAVKNTSSTIIKEYALAYGYFQSTNTISANSTFNTNMACYLKRLKLTSVQELPVISGATAKPAYLFTYDETNPLPFALSFQQDYWGYYNGNTSATCAIPCLYYYPNDAFTSTYAQLAGSRSSLYSWPSSSGEVHLTTASNGFTDRSPNVTYMKSGLLTKITFPTHGETSLVYEANDFYYMGANHTGGGLRIKTITQYDGADHSKDIIKNYSYTQTASPTLSAGKVLYLPQFVRDISRSYLTVPQPPICNIFSNSVGQLGSTYGVVVGYTEVTTDYNGIGKTVSAFSLPAEVGVEHDNLVSGSYVYNRTHSQVTTSWSGGSFSSYGDQDDYPFAPNPNYDFARGNLLEEKVYDSANHLVKHTMNEYTLISRDANIPAVKAVFSGGYSCSTGGPGFVSADFNYAQYYLISAWYAQTKKTTELYDPAFAGSVLSTVENYYYDNASHKLLTRTTSTDSKGKTITSQTTYPQDYTVAGTYPEAAALSTMAGSKHMHSFPVEKFVWEDDGTGKKLLSAQLTTYTDCQSTTGTSNGTQILPAKNYVFETNTPLAQASVVSTTFPSSALSMDSHYAEKGSLFYDSKDNLIKYRYLNAGNYNTMSYLWGHSQQYPIAKVTNATEVDIAATSFESDDQNKWIISGTANPLVSTDGHTGTSCRQVNAASNGPTYEMVPSSGFQSKKFVFSCWVKTASTFGAGAGSLVLYTTNNTPGGTVVYPSSAAEASKTKTFGSTNNVWTYMEVIIDMGKVKTQGGIGTTTLKLRAYVQNIGSTGIILVDDLRLYPVEARMSTYTYLPLVGTSSETNENSQAVFYEYDEYNRLKLTRDLNGNIIEKTDYHYKP